VLGLSLASLLAGCGEPNEAEFREGAAGKTGFSDPKAVNTSESYAQRYKDSVAAAKATPKGKPGSQATKPAPSPTEKEASGAPPAEAKP
jgi:hypothetical protein